MQPTAIASSVAPVVIAPAIATGSASAGAAPFGDLLKDAVSGVDGLQQQASSAVEGLLRGTGVDVHEAMIATQKADMSFELALAVRNKAVAAYQQVMGMQF
ncbi:MAG TPA: flagellar hook-basal body complex protein FliE [Acidobacteriaceae bacterium]|jgi:flagellar hook-basal body complex protein FliE